MTAIGVLTACLGSLIIGMGLAVATMRLRTRGSAAFRHAQASAAFWMTACSPVLLGILGCREGASTLGWRMAAAAFPAGLEAQPWLVTLAQAGIGILILLAAAGAARLLFRAWQIAGIRVDGLLPKGHRLPVRTARIPGPMLLGYRRPMVVMPDTSAGTNPRVWRALVRHELAHARRGDNWRLLAESIVMGLLPWCWPLRHLHQVIASSREELCDAVALRHANADTRAGYARALVDALRRTATEPTLVPRMAGAFHDTHRRLVSILEPTDAARPPGRAWWTYACMSLAFAMMGAGAIARAGSWLDLIAGTRGMAMHFSPAAQPGQGIYRVLAFGGVPRSWSPGNYRTGFSRRADGSWVVTAAPVSSAP